MYTCKGSRHRWLQKIDLGYEVLTRNCEYATDTGGREYVNSQVVGRLFICCSGAVMTLGKGGIYGTSTRQRVNTRSSTEYELVGVNDAMPQILWTRYCFSRLKDTMLKIQLSFRIIRVQYCWKRIARHRAAKELATLTSDISLLLIILRQKRCQFNTALHKRWLQICLQSHYRASFSRNLEMRLWMLIQQLLASRITGVC